jgi:hypothetical protein
MCRAQVEIQRKGQWSSRTALALSSLKDSGLIIDHLDQAVVSNPEPGVTSSVGEDADMLIA